MDKLKLSPVKVPWAVELAVSGIRLIVNELQGYERTTISFSAMLIPKIYQKPIYSEAKIVEITFEGVAFTATYGIDFKYSQYDWTLVYPKKMLATLDENHRVLNVPEWEKINDLWKRECIGKGFSGDSYVYTIQDSPKIAELGLTKQPEYEHFLIVGHDMYAEIVGRGWQWRFQQE